MPERAEWSHASGALSPSQKGGDRGAKRFFLIRARDGSEVEGRDTIPDPRLDLRVVFLLGF